jgi:hypothetical protein
VPVKLGKQYEHSTSRGQFQRILETDTAEHKRQQCENPIECCTT